MSCCFLVLLCIYAHLLCTPTMYTMCQAFQKIANRCAKLKFDMTETLANSTSFFPSSSSSLLLLPPFELLCPLLSFVFFDIILPYFSHPLFGLLAIAIIIIAVVAAAAAAAAVAVVVVTCGGTFMRWLLFISFNVCKAALLSFYFWFSLLLLLLLL